MKQKKCKIKPGEYAVLRQAVDAQVYRLENVQGNTANLSYKRGNGRSSTSCDVGLLQTPSAAQITRAEKNGEV